MRTAIAISCVLIGASAGAGFALSALHKATFATTDSVASLAAPVVEAEPTFVIPRHVPVRKASAASTIVAPEQTDIVPAVAVIEAPEAPLLTLEAAPEDVVLVTPHIGSDALKVPEMGIEMPRRATQAVYTAPVRQPAIARAAPSANAPMIVSHVSTSGHALNPQEPEYAHGVYR
ncbi:MAG: hypothetical protein AAFP28_03120 [Pseudomonadota bacterium]